MRSITDTFAGITVVSGASGDLVTVYCMGSLIPALMAVQQLLLVNQ
jgi:hypothetical protein